MSDADDDLPRIGPGAGLPRAKVLTPAEKRARIRAGQTPIQNAIAVVFVGLIALAGAGALVRLNIWLWLGR